MIQSQQAEFEQFLTDIREPDGMSISAERFATKLELPLSRLTELAGAGPDLPESPTDSPQIQMYMEAAVQVLAAATELAGGDCRRALLWFRNEPIQPLGHKTPAVLVSEGGSNKLLLYIATLYAGTG